MTKEVEIEICPPAIAKGALRQTDNLDEQKEVESKIDECNRNS